jgi:hypothetical protein
MCSLGIVVRILLLGISLNLCMLVLIVIRMPYLQCFLDPKTLVSALTLLVGVVGGIIAYFSFLRTEKWKRAEFLAKEMKDFFADPQVRTTMVLIDWGTRRLRLQSPDFTDGVVVQVTRSLQSSALRPHNILGGGDFTIAKSQEQSEAEMRQRFDDAEVAIRDCYGRFLDGLETFANYVESQLCEVKDLRPFLGYWIEVLQSPENGSAECAWKASMLTFIHYYGYPGVQFLFKEFGFDISKSGKTYRGFLAQMNDGAFASALASSVGTSFP